MLDIIKEILCANKEISGYEIVVTSTASKELFLVKKDIDMDRAKYVEYYKVSVYMDINENGKLYKGAASTVIHPTMTKEEILEEINEAIFASQFAKNEYYPLVKCGQVYNELNESYFKEKDLSSAVMEIAKAVYEKDIYEEGGINSSEIFLDKTYTRVINSEGVDVSYEGFSAMVEFITTWKGKGEEIELYNCLKFSDLNREEIINEVKHMINSAKERANAKTITNINDVPVILTGSSVKSLLNYYYSKSKAASVYNQQSNYKVGEKVYGNDVSGDLITLTIDPFMNNSTFSAPFSSDGLALKAKTIIENGILKSYIANNKFAHYLNVEPTGDTLNFTVAGGSKSIDEFKTSPYLEIQVFSDFTVDEITGNFGGEFRLGHYYDGFTITPVTGGSISGNINKVQDTMCLSKEVEQQNNFNGPKAIKLTNISIVGNS